MWLWRDLSSPAKDGTHLSPPVKGQWTDREFFDVMINGTVSLISPSYSSLSVFRNVFVSAY